MCCWYVDMGQKCVSLSLCWTGTMGCLMQFAIKQIANVITFISWREEKFRSFLVLICVARHCYTPSHNWTDQTMECYANTHIWGSCWKYFQFWLQTSLFSPTRWGSHKNSNYLLTSQGSPPLSAGFKAAWCSKKHGAKIGIYLVDVWGIFNLPLGYLLCLQSSRISQSFGQFEYEQAYPDLLKL